jgi:hypothetical protein
MADFGMRLRRMHALWRANAILSRMPEHLRRALPQKFAAFEMFRGHRDEWGYERLWQGDYLALGYEHELLQGGAQNANSYIKLVFCLR